MGGSVAPRRGPCLCRFGSQFRPFEPRHRSFTHLELNKCDAKRRVLWVRLMKSKLVACLRIRVIQPGIDPIKLARGPKHPTVLWPVAPAVCRHLAAVDINTVPAILVALATAVSFRAHPGQFCRSKTISFLTTNQGRCPQLISNHP